jgi:hypothetical protein
MKFELKPTARGLATEKVVEDVRRVANMLGKHSLTEREYNVHGHFSSSCIRRRTGKSWFNVLALAGLGAARSPLNIPKQELIKDLVRIARVIRKDAVTREEYREHGKYSISTYAKRFGSWFKALDSAGLERTRTLGVTSEEYFTNLQEVWIRLGRQPRYAEMQRPVSRYSAGAYEDRFGSWRKALEAFVAYVNAEPQKDTTKQDTESPSSVTKSKVGSTVVKSDFVHRTKRQVSDRLRFLVMRRDRFTCRLCGRSPATHFPLDLVIDHVKPWAKEGETTYENLQTLCRPCNGGKGDLGQSE